MRGREGWNGSRHEKKQKNGKESVILLTTHYIGACKPRFLNVYSIKDSCTEHS